ncbi:MAG TPA: peptidoglycan DD-metalloendopeptidase family protein [Gaiellaceae bacterium]|nr:peptidoglycan DD-metalloendopeptidase family protein [Gaiellaceae bacterium]
MPRVLSRNRMLCGALAALVLVALAPAAAAMGKPRIAALQVGLQARGLYAGTIHGRADDATRTALRAFERRRGLAADGLVDRATRTAFGRYGRYGLGARSLRTGMRGWDVAALQFLLAWHGFPSGTFDGELGPRTDAALRRYQAWRGLGADGVAGPATVRALRRDPPPASPLAVRAPLDAAAADRFGPRGSRFHAGIDFPARSGARVRAARAGVVVSAGWDAGGFGNLVVVRHGRGLRTLYAHLAAVRVAKGERVEAGERLGAVGATGLATGPHLHLELRVRGAAVDPLPALR